jgi:hypothetical protein
MLPIFCPSVPS